MTSTSKSGHAPASEPSSAIRVALESEPAFAMTSTSSLRPTLVSEPSFPMMSESALARRCGWRQRRNYRVAMMLASKSEPALAMMLTTSWRIAGDAVGTELGACLRWRCSRHRSRGLRWRREPSFAMMLDRSRSLRWR